MANSGIPIQAIFDHLVGRSAEVLPIAAAGVTMISAGADLTYIAASDEPALLFEQPRTDLGEAL